MQITVETRGLDTVLRSLGVDLPKQVKYATMLALSRTASKLRDRQYSEMHHVFDRPTPYTLRGLRVKPAKKTDLTAWVGFKEAWALRAAKYMPTQVEGGTRKLKAYEKAIQQRVIMRPWNKAYPAGTYFIPGRGARLDAYGNMSSGQINQILSDLQAQGDTKANTTTRSAGRNKGRGRYWATPKGIWHILGQAMTMVLVATQTPPAYSKRYPFYEISERFVREHWDEEFNKAFKEAVATAK